LHYFRKPDETIINSATSNSHTLPNSNFIMGKKEKNRSTMEKTFKINPQKVQRILQSVQVILHKVTMNEKIQVPDQLYILITLL